ncbi:hypothetical protein B0H12DRAFT_1233625 [Mycena haematopus]|nr:hypothetical protein B0H12DRAFT_1233625 [Mycena haematopus]
MPSLGPLDPPLPALDLPEPDSNGLPVIEIFHTGYDPPKAILTFTVCPLPNGIFVFPSDIVLDACRILANNAEGTLYDYPPTQNTGPLARGLKLAPGAYHYIVAGKPQFPICRRFLDWTPPTPGEIPHWVLEKTPSGPLIQESKSQASATVRRLDSERCVITGDSGSVDAAHLIPHTASKWYLKFFLYRRASDYLNPHVMSINNMLTLRSDLNGRLEADPSLSSSTCEVKLPERVRPFYLYVRFAWNMFLLAKPLLSAHEGSVMRFVPSQDDVDLHYHPYAEPDGGENDQKGLQGKTTRDVRANRRTGKRRREGEGEDENEDKDKEKRGKRRRQARSGMATSRDPKAGRDDEGGAAGPSRPPRRGPGPPKRDSGPPATRSRTRTTDNSKKQRQATDHIGPKKCDVVDIPDLDVLKPHDIEMMRGIDRLLQGGTYSAGSNPDWYPGFSQIAQLAYEYKQAHPAVTDPGRARIALISERVEE